MLACVVPNLLLFCCWVEGLLPELKARLRCLSLSLPLPLPLASRSASE